MILDDIVARKRKQLDEERELVSLQELERMALRAPTVRDFEAGVRRCGLSIIAEVKKASPSKGIIATDFRPVEQALAYEAGGADCLSVLTEQYFFQGSDEILKQVRAAVELPVLRKDFMIEERQVVEARAIGADAILLIAAILDDETMLRLYRLANEYGLHTLFEAHTAEETDRVVQLGARLVGINNRNLNTFEVDLHTFEILRGRIPKHCAAIAESGIHSREDASFCYGVGADALLVGESLMRSGSVVDTLRQFKGVAG